MIARHLYGYNVTQCLYVAAKLDIADHLLHGKKSISELAALTSSQQEPLYRVLRCLVSLGFFTEEDNHYFSLNKSAEDLLSNTETTWKDYIILCGEVLYQASGQLLQTVKTNVPAFEYIHGMSFWEYLDKHPQQTTLFHDAMEKGTESMMREIIKNYDFSSYKNIIDIGGGKGHLLCEILRQHPDKTGVVFDRANAKQPATEYITQNNLSNRCQFITGDFFETVPTNGDIYLLKVILHDWDDESASLILKNCSKVMNKNSRLLIIEKVIDEDAYKDLACLGDINMLVMVTGKERSLSEFQELLAKNGLKMLQRIGTKTPFSIIEVETA